MVEFNEQYEKKLKEAFEHFVKDEPYDYSFMREYVYASWVRSKRYGVDYKAKWNLDELSTEETKKMRTENAAFIQAARKHMNKIFDIVKPTGYYIYISDYRGYILDIFSDFDLMSQFEDDPTLVIGASRSERCCGTNAIGTCLNTGKTIVLWGEEHYMYTHKMYTCAGAAVKGPDGKVIGAISITGLKEDYRDHTLAIVTAVAEAIEVELANTSATGVKQTFEYTFDTMIGESEGIVRLKNIAKRVALIDSPILIWGESGTGKEVLAQSIHNESARKGKPFIAINCGAIPKELIESELFGYDGGAFTGASQKGHIGKIEAASGGTLFLDEVESMPLDVQIKLLRVLSSYKLYRIGSNEEVDVDIRLISATKSNLDTDSEEGRFREDLYYRINTITLKIPPLRDRGDDIILLADYYIDMYKNKMHISELEVPDSFYKMLTNYRWKGNVRELRNIIESAVAMSVEGGVIDTSMLPSKIVNNEPFVTGTEGRDLADVDFSKSKLKEVEVLHIKRIMKEKHGNISAVAKELGIARSTLYKKLKSDPELSNLLKKR